MNEDSKGQLTTADLAYGQKNGEGRPNNDGQARNDRDVSNDRPEQSAPGPLLPEQELAKHRERWTSIQAEFVDEPKKSVQEADGLVAEVVQQLATKFADERKTLEQQWSGGGEASTEDLRKALQHYRSFFERLLSA